MLCVLVPMGSALPGSVEDPCSQLPHRLIADGACLISGAADVLAVLAPHKKIEKAGKAAAARARHPREKRPASRPAEPIKPAAPREWPQDLPQAYLRVLRALEHGETEYDALCEATDVPGGDMGALLMELEMDGWVESLPGLRYRLAK